MTAAASGAKHSAQEAGSKGQDVRVNYGPGALEQQLCGPRCCLLNRLGKGRVL